MAQNTFTCVSIGSRELLSSHEYCASDTRSVNQCELNSDSNITDIYDFQAPKQAERPAFKNAKLCQISSVKKTGSPNKLVVRKSVETTCHCGVVADNGNSVDSDSECRIMGANHSYSLKARQEMKKNGEGKFSSSDDLCIKPEEDNMSDKRSYKEFHTLSKREKEPIPSSPTSTKENGQQYSYAYSEAKCNTTPRNRVKLGEYIEPADATNFTWGHKSRKTSEPSQNYSEPYETRKVCDLKQSPSWKRRLHPGGGVVYELAKSPEVIYDQPPSRQEEEDDDEIDLGDYNKLHRNNSLSLSEKGKIPDNYDHVPDKQKPVSVEDVLGCNDKVDSTGCDLKQLVIDSNNSNYSLATDVKSMHVKNGHMDDPSIYEEPWDSKLKQQELHKKIQRAHSRTEEPPRFVKQLSSPSSTSSSSFGDKQSSPEIKTKISIKSPSNSSGNTYEDAWDSPQRQQQLQEQLRKAQQSVSTSSSSSNTYEDAWDTPERLNQFQQRIQRAVSHENNPKPKPPASEIGMYQEPWDSTAKQKELQEKLQANMRGHRKQSGGSLSAHSTSSQLSVGSSGSPSSPTRRAFHPDSRCEECVDHRGRKRSSGSTTKSSQSLSSSSGGSPTHRGRHVIGSYCTVGVRINPLIPVDCQPWYHGNISRIDAERMLRVCKEGSYLVRDSESEKGQKSLSLKSRSLNIHVKITCKINGMFVLGENSRDFHSIPEMIDYYTQHLLPLKGAEHITLIHPVDSKWADQNL